MRALRSTARIKDHQYSMSIIYGIIELQGFLRTLVKPQEARNALNVINPIDDPTGHDIQLKLTLKTQSKFIDVLVQTFSGAI